MELKGKRRVVGVDSGLVCAGAGGMVETRSRKGNAERLFHYLGVRVSSPLIHAFYRAHLV